MKNAYKQWKTAIDDLTYARSLITEQHSQQTLLQYQVSELDQLNLTDSEVHDLQQEHSPLAHAQHLIETAGYAINALNEDPEQSLLNQLNHIHKQLIDAEAIDTSLKNINDMLNDAQISLQEATWELRHYHDGISLDPERLHFINNRLNNIHNLARKHHIQPEELFVHHQRLTEKLQQFSQTEEDLVALEQTVINTEKQYVSAAEKLTSAANMLLKN